ncbi:hypothetical protein BN7_191 [Wickerhamomyces ciferrii]|uniref:FACT complex subunit n=1 Tax=Wickerhamomyces ciferrii (strain ATCC 14091 / BCRC 22168 / CBS 111 / JCM 3599 / NBRC 0793 / NRRL Y-1031 F-60-10) TaxID=1206466 RepID=K0KEJ9_WICCF|nr:uncharacterized protein BN7_191 [Wickerhamomyces ciferrii]CCH40657.1 hypothetical protein BN7_191 [Wickerhamomyces ciferrii]
MSTPTIDSITFKKRVAILQKRLSDGAFNGAKTLLIVTGASDEENPYKKTTSLHNWLLGYEFPATIIYFTTDKVVFITSAGKLKYLNPLKSNSVDIWTRTKDTEHNSKIFDDFLVELKKSSKIGMITKDSFRGKFIDEWNLHWNKIKSDLEIVDIASGISGTLEIKDDEELRKIRIAAKLSDKLLQDYEDELTEVLDKDEKTTNVAQSDKIETRLDNNKLLNTITKQVGADPNADNLDWCYTPIVQSGGKFELKPSAQSNEERFHGFVIIVSLGFRYQSYCSNLSRTFMVDPPKEVEDNYSFLLKIQDKVLENLKPGSTGSQVYNKTLDFIKSERPDLEKHFLKNVGWAIGLEFRDSSFLLNAKNERVIHDKSTFNITLGFQDLVNSKASDPKSKNYALQISQTVKIQHNEAKILTDYSTDISKVSFHFQEEEDDIKKEVNELGDAPRPKREASAPTANSKILKSKLRTETKNHDENEEQRQKQIQKELMEKRQREGLQRFSDTNASDINERKATFRRYESYVRESQIPSFVKDLKIHVDHRTNTIIIPISGRPVPFHINAFKNGSKTEEGDYTYLRLNFNSPGAGGNTTKKDEIPYEDDPKKEFLRSLTLKSKDGEHMSKVYKEITDLKKESVKRETEKKAMADVVAQAKLIEAKPGRLRRLDNVFARPSPDTKRVGGSLSIHENGLRYQSPLKMDSRIDVLFSNVKHLFFQPSKDELIVVIHVHLKSPLIIGKKKTFDLQFYREASDISIDETGGNRRGQRRYGDEDELEQEQEERRRKAALDKEFRKFGELISNASGGLFDLDIPFRELGFSGVPFRSSTFLMPTRDCLVQLIDPPFLVVTLEEIEIAHLERVQFGLKNFDLVFVFKDFKKPVVHINTIPMELLEDVKSWLTDVDIPYTESTINLNWLTIMKTLQADPKQFFLDGGWSFLGGGSDEEQSSEEEEESEFEASDEDPSDEDVQSEDDYSEGGGSDGSGSGSDFDESEEEGEDWDELDKKAAKEDSRGGYD